MLPCSDWPIKICMLGNKMIIKHQQLKCIETLLHLTIFSLTFTAPLEETSLLFAPGGFPHMLYHGL